MCSGFRISLPFYEGCSYGLSTVSFILVEAESREVIKYKHT